MFLIKVSEEEFLDHHITVKDVKLKWRKKEDNTGKVFFRVQERQNRTYLIDNKNFRNSQLKPLPFKRNRVE